MMKTTAKGRPSVTAKVIRADRRLRAQLRRLVALLREAMR